ncbi:hypothetical protein NX059_001932 [Plenodomus lindquistii]|nr:hypothetical protein NX059_001932 [Plenodomus lindquistii]
MSLTPPPDLVITEPMADTQPAPAATNNPESTHSKAETGEPASPCQKHDEEEGTEQTLDNKMSNEDLYEDSKAQPDQAAQPQTTVDSTNAVDEIDDAPGEVDTNMSEPTAPVTAITADDPVIAPISRAETGQPTTAEDHEPEVNSEDKIEDVVQKTETLTSEKTGDVTDAPPVEAPKASLPTSNVPPHLRPTSRAPAEPLYGLHHSRHSEPASTPPRNYRSQHFEPPRPRYNQSQYQHAYTRNDGMEREQAARLHAEVLSLKRVLEVERKTSANMRKTIEMEQQRKSEAAFSSMLGSLMRGQEEAHVMKARAEAKMRDLEQCTKKIEQMEVFLAEGQKQLYFKLDQQGVRPMSAVEREHLKRDAELTVERKLADALGELHMRSERLGLRESAQQLREQQYKTSIRAALEAEIRAAVESSNDAEEIADIEYNCGYAAGKEAAKIAASKEAAKKAASVVEHKDSFIEGYAAYHRAQTALDDLHHGRITSQSPRLAFLFDAGHADNFLVRGMQMGQLRMDTATAFAHHPHPTSNDEVSKPALNTTPPTASINIQSGAPPTPPMSTERIRRIPPPRPTLAAELRGATPMFNGAYVLANGGAGADTSAKPVVKTGCFADVGVDLINL